MLKVRFEYSLLALVTHLALLTISAMVSIPVMLAIENPWLGATVYGGLMVATAPVRLALLNLLFG